jgi:signal transduction histidine kinase
MPNPPRAGYRGSVISRIRALAGRARRLDPFRADAMLAAALVVAALIESALVGTDGDSRTVTAAVAVVALVPIAWRRRSPLFATGAFVVVCVAQTALDSFFFSTLTTAFVTFLLLNYTTGRHALGWRLWAQSALLLGGVWLTLALEGSGDAEELLWAIVLFALPLLAGRGVRNRVLLQREMREKAARLEAEREVRARTAIEEERARIASELQAVVANGVSAMVVQAGAVPRVLAAGDTTGAADALAAIEEIGRDALAEMRRLLGVLRHDGEGAPLAPSALGRAGRGSGAHGSHGGTG